MKQPGKIMFERALLETSVGANQRGMWAWGVSILLQAALVSVLALLPLLYTEAIPRRLVVRIFAPPAVPPPAPAEAPGGAVPDRGVQSEFEQGRLIAPVRVPETVSIITDEVPPSPPALAGLPGGIEGGIGAGSGSDWILSILGPPPSIPPPPPAEPRSVRPMQVGGSVQQAKLISQQKPQYPPLARQVRISGTVRLAAIISKTGAIEQLQVLSGHPMLAQAALEAVKTWRYKPTILNGQPVKVQTTVDVIFRLFS